MADVNPSIVVALFVDPVSAINAVKALRDAGFDSSQIGHIARSAADTGILPGEIASTDAAAAVLATGMAAGAAGAAGLAPGGMIAATAIGAAMIASGTLENGVHAALTGAGMSEEEAGYFANEYDSDRSIVIVKTADRAAEASQILKRHGGVGRIRKPETNEQ